MMTCVWMSSPVTMFPTDLRAGVCTDVDACMSSSTRRRGIPASITAWNLVVGAVRQVRDGPAGVDEDFVIQAVDQLRQDRESRSDLFRTGASARWHPTTGSRSVRYSPSASLAAASCRGRSCSGST